MKRLLLVLLGITLLLISYPSYCVLKGGKFGRIGLNPLPECNLPAGDAGKECIDSYECEGLCLAENINSTSGKCSEWKIVVGCVYVLFKGKAEFICID